jgi:hypothetical protein
MTGEDGKQLDGSTPEGMAEIQKRMAHQQQMRDELAKLVKDDQFSGGNGRKGGFHWSM